MKTVEFAIIMSYLTRVSVLIVLLKTAPKIT